MTEHFVRVNDDGVVVEVITLATGSAPISMTYPPAFVATLRRLTGTQIGQVLPGWRLVDGAYSAPIPATPPVMFVSAALARERLEADGFWDEFSAILGANPAAMLKVLTLREGIDPGDPQANALIAACGADPSRILAAPGTVLAPLTPPPPAE